MPRITVPLTIFLAALAVAACSGNGANVSSPTPGVASPTQPVGAPSPTPPGGGDGELAYLRARGATTGYLLRLVRADGSGDRQVADNVLGFTWSPRGDSIAYWTSQGDVDIVPVAVDGTVGQVSRIGAGDSAVFGPAGESVAFRQPKTGEQGSTIMAVSTVRPGTPSVLVDQGPPAAELAGKGGPPGWDWYPLGWSADGRLLLTGSPVAGIGASGNRGYHFFVLNRSLMELPSGDLFGGQPRGAALRERDGLAASFTTTAHVSACEGEGSVVVVDSMSVARAFKLASMLPKPSPGAQVQERPYGVAWLDSDALLYSAGAFNANLCRLPQPVGPNAAGALGGPYLYKVPLDGTQPLLLLEDAAWPSVRQGMLSFTRGAPGQQPMIYVAHLDKLSGAVPVAEGEQPQWRP